jgi:glycosyltransferase involved in cell wall biosynthesis
VRVVIVSAHYPPNFVSGGTVAAQRLARGLRDRGHDVSVYAGRLDAGQRPLSTSEELDDVGLAVRWIVTTDAIDWSSTRNYDNPPVTADFSAYLARERPDVVHLHTLQSLGAGLVGAAAERGARVVVTMHDFWWFCARQFLVDRDLRPCSLVVDAGVCECQVDRPWLAARTRFLRDQLGRVDVVLAPSSSAARVFAANGVPVNRLKVDENGLPEADVPARAHRPARRLRPPGPVRFLYAGGSNPMKGVQDLFAAARHLTDRAGWHLRAYGTEEHVSASGEEVDARHVDVLEAFEPSELDRILSESDVLVIPSVMRESHSIITREALMRGVAVVCTDSLGPEEVVEHGRNGLVVPTGSPLALSRAMRRLVDEPGLLERLQSVAPAVAVRALSAQLDTTEAVYSSPLPARAAAAVRRVLFVCGIEGAPLRYRARLPAEALELLGVESEVRHYRDPALEQLVASADAVVMYRVPATVQVLALIDAARAEGTPVLFDVDDLIFDPSVGEAIPALKLLPPEDAELWMQGVHRYRTTMEACDMFVGSTRALVDHAARVTGMPAERYPNGVGIVMAQLSDAAGRRPRAPGRPRIGYLSGTTTHDHDWLHIEPAVISVLRRRPDVELWLGGHVTPSPALRDHGDQVRRLPMLPWTELPDVLRDLDVNLAPLEPGSIFNEAKSAIKWLEAALTATPTIASPTEPFRDAITDGDNGILASTPDDWARAMEALLDDGDARARVGERARRDALLRWSPHLQGERYLGILERARRRVTEPRPRATSGWIPVVLDEPPAEVRLEGYELPLSRGAVPVPDASAASAVSAAGAGITPAFHTRLTGWARRGRAVWREEGAVAALRAAARALRRVR